VNELQRSSTGTLTATVSNRGDAITSLGLHKRQWIRVRSQWLGVTYAEWQGILEGLPKTWPGYTDALVTLQAAGVFKVLKLYPLDGTTRPAERNDQRVAAWCTAANLATTGFSTDTDMADAVTTPYPTSTDALTQATQVEESDNGLMVETRDGALQFQGRHYRLVNSATPKATFGETAGTQIPYQDDATWSDDDSLLATYVAVTPLGGSAQVAQDVSAQNKHWVSTLTRSLVSSDNALAMAAAQYLLAKYKNPSPRIPLVTVNLAAVNSVSPSKIPTLLGTNVSDRYTWTRNAPTPITQDVFVEQIHETIKPGSWQMQFELSPALDDIGWVLGDAVNGLLGTTTNLNY